MAEAVQRFLEAEERSGKARTTLRNYRADLYGLARTAGSRVTPRMLAGAAKRHLDALELAEASWNRHLTTLRRFFAHLVQTGIMEINPLEGVERHEAAQAQPDVAGTGDVRRLIARIDNVRDRALVVLLWQTGLRVSEALGLRASDVDLGRRMITTPPPDRRRVRMPAEAREVMGDYLTSRALASNDPVFVAQGGRPLSYAGAHRLFRLYAGTSGVTMRSMRARAAVQAFDDGASLAQVQHMLGHRTAASTLRYHSAFGPFKDQPTKRT